MLSCTCMNVCLHTSIYVHASPASLRLWMQAHVQTVCSDVTVRWTDWSLHSAGPRVMHPEASSAWTCVGIKTKINSMNSDTPWGRQRDGGGTGRKRVLKEKLKGAMSNLRKWLHWHELNVSAWTCVTNWGSCKAEGLSKQCIMGGILCNCMELQRQTAGMSDRYLCLCVKPKFNF